MNSYSIYNFVCECILKIDKVIDRIYKCVSKDELCKCHYTVGVIINGTLVFLNFSAQDASILKISVPKEEVLRIPKHLKLAKFG